MQSTLVAAFIVIGSAISGAACGGTAVPAPSSPPRLTAKAPGEAQVGDAARCPVSGETFVVSAASPKVEHEGKTYYFCCADCAAKFQANTRQYVGHPGESPQATY